jgi:hypothetical protein
MSTRFFAVGLIFVCCLSFASCRKKCTRECSESDLSVYTRGFAETDLDTVQILEFSNNGQFNDLRNEAVKINQFTEESTSHLGTHIGWFSKHSDWVIKMPSSQRSFSISAITDEGKRTIEEDCRVKGTICQNEIASFRLDGTERINNPAFLDK